MEFQLRVSDLIKRRFLQPEEWERLIGTEAETVWPHLDSRTAQVLVVEDPDGRIIGTWTFIQMLHAECVWIAPDHRGNAGVVRQLLTGLRDTAKARNLQVVATSAVTDEVKALLEHLGATKLEGDHYVMRMPCPLQ